MKRFPLIALLFYFSAFYDGILGVLFLVRPLALFSHYGVTPPNHLGYVQFPGLLLILFAVMFLRIAMNPAKNRNLIPYGIGLKVSYAGTVFWYWFTQGVPGMWKPFAAIDTVMAVLFVVAYIRIGRA